MRNAVLKCFQQSSFYTKALTAIEKILGKTDKENTERGGDLAADRSHLKSCAHGRALSECSLWERACAGSLVFLQRTVVLGQNLPSFGSHETVWWVLSTPRQPPHFGPRNELKFIISRTMTAEQRTFHLQKTTKVRSIGSTVKLSKVKFQTKLKSRKEKLYSNKVRLLGWHKTNTYKLGSSEGPYRSLS